MVRPLTHDGYEVDVSGINVEFFIAYVDVNGVSAYSATPYYDQGWRIKDALNQSIRLSDVFARHEAGKLNDHASKVLAAADKLLEKAAVAKKKARTK